MRAMLESEGDTFGKLRGHQEISTTVIYAFALIENLAASLRAK